MEYLKNCELVRQCIESTIYILNKKLGWNKWWIKRNTSAGADTATRQADERNKGVTFKNCAPFIKYISRINNTEIDNTNGTDIVMPMYNLIEYSDN